MNLKNVMFLNIELHSMMGNVFAVMDKCIEKNEQFVLEYHVNSEGEDDGYGGKMWYLGLDNLNESFVYDNNSHLITDVMLLNKVFHNKIEENIIARDWTIEKVARELAENPAHIDKVKDLLILFFNNSENSDILSKWRDWFVGR
jgi:uncharacterized membrane protein YheB (UPF0754 family)